MNKKLRSLKNFVKVYIDDLIIFSKDFDLYLEHLRKFFQLLKKLKIIINSKKTFLNYLNITLLEQKVDVFKLITTQKRIETLINIKFFIDLETLKRYLRLTKWMRNKITYYTQKTKSLQREKILLLKKSSTIKE